MNERAEEFNMIRILAMGSAGAGAIALLAACGGGDSRSTTASPATPVASATTGPTKAAETAASSATAATSATRGTVGTASPVPSGKVSANKATRAQLQAAFEAAGIGNAAQWAKEVEEYRPYPLDANFPKLRQELAKYNPGPGVVDKIVATLEP